MRPKENVLMGEISGKTGTNCLKIAHKDGMVLTMENGTM